MGIFSDIPIRGNGETVDSSWWNSIRTALISAFGSGILGETQQSITDGQSASDVTSLLFAAASIVRAKVEISAYSTDGTNTRTHFITLWAYYNAKLAQWRITQEEIGESCTSAVCTAVASGLTFTITSGGQVQVAADTIGGTPVRKIRWKVVSTFAVES